jgi:hypothetical protein
VGWASGPNHESPLDSAWTVRPGKSATDALQVEKPFPGGFPEVGPTVAKNLVKETFTPPFGGSVCLAASCMFLGPGTGMAEVPPAAMRASVWNAVKVSRRQHPAPGGGSAGVLHLPSAAAAHLWAGGSSSASSALVAISINPIPDRRHSRRPARERCSTAAPGVLLRDHSRDSAIQ